MTGVALLLTGTLFGLTVTVARETEPGADVDCGLVAVDGESPQAASWIVTRTLHAAWTAALTRLCFKVSASYALVLSTQRLRQLMQVLFVLGYFVLEQFVHFPLS
jgi:hypothetical protein